jgi:predicted metal-dependent hydrolase
MDTTLPWPPPFIIKKSARARHVRLKTSARHGLELIVPARFNQKHIPEILETNKIWIEKQFAKIHLEFQQYQANQLPQEISLLAVQQLWKVTYLKTFSKKIQIMTRPDRELVLVGDIDNKALCHKKLNQWVQSQAILYLTQRLYELSLLTKLTYKDIWIRNQKSRWGSCSTEKKICLNNKLIFMPAELADHIIIHELCHTVFMDHSPKFWRLVASFDSEWKQHSKTVKRAEKYIPPWSE